MKLLALLFIIQVFVFSFAYAQDDKISEFNQEKIETIDLIKGSLKDTKELLLAKEIELKKITDPMAKASLENDIKRLRERYNKIKINLVAVVTDIKIDEIKKTEEIKKRDLLQEAQELLGPAIDTIQRISAKPRKIESLKNELATYQEKIALTDIALKNIDRVTKSEDFKLLAPDLESYIEEAKFNVNELRQELSLKVERINRSLKELTKDDKSVLDATTSLVKDFLSNKGKNLVISTFVFFFVIWSISKLRKNVLLPIIERFPDIVLYKTINALYGFIAIASATIFALFTLYLLGDWVLVTFLVLFISGTLWAFKDYIRKLTAEGRLILNLGAIKEGDLIVYDNLPWRVKNISFITTFENPYLDTPLLNIEISEILKMHSRKILPNEQWFPSKKGDWVLLADETYGEVILQTPQQVVIELLTTAKKHYPTVQYLSQNPTNLSNGFSIDLIWGIDYQDQDKLIKTIIPHLENGFKNIFTKYLYSPNRFTIDFHSAGASSLNLNFIGNFEGKHASKRLQIIKDIQKILLELSTEAHFNIPFNQLVVHLDSSQA